MEVVLPGFLHRGEVRGEGLEKRWEGVLLSRAMQLPRGFAFFHNLSCVL